MSSENNKTLLTDKKILNLGLSYPFQLPPSLDVTTVPIIKIKKCRFSRDELEGWHQKAMHADAWIFSSKTAVAHFFATLPKEFQYPAKILSIGQATTSQLYKQGVVQVIEGRDPTQEGLLQLIDENMTKGAALFWPRSTQSRNFLSHQVLQRGYVLDELPLYSPEVNHTLHPLDLTSFDALLFTSSSTVDAYFHLYQNLCRERILLCIGPITHQKLLDEVKKACLKDLPKILMVGEITKMHLEDI